MVFSRGEVDCRLGDGSVGAGKVDLSTDVSTSQLTLGRSPQRTAGPAWWTWGTGWAPSGRTQRSGLPPSCIESTALSAVFRSSAQGVPWLSETFNRGGEFFGNPRRPQAYATGGARPRGTNLKICPGPGFALRLRWLWSPSTNGFRLEVQRKDKPDRFVPTGAVLSPSPRPLPQSPGLC
jgi:hypothetical protein